MTDDQKRILLNLLSTVDDVRKSAFEMIERGSDTAIMNKIHSLTNVCNDVKDIADSFIKQNALLRGERI